MVEDKKVTALFNQAQSYFIGKWLSHCICCFARTQALSLGAVIPDCKKCGVPKLVRKVFPRHYRGYGFRQFWETCVINNNGEI